MKKYLKLFLLMLFASVSMMFMSAQVYADCGHGQYYRDLEKSSYEYQDDTYCIDHAYWVCQKCGDVFTNTVKKKHNFDDEDTQAYNSTVYESVSDTQHTQYNIYYCSQCWHQFKTAVGTYNHEFYSSDQYQKVSDTQCKKITTYSCRVCGYTKTTTEMVDHYYKVGSPVYSKISDSQCGVTKTYTCEHCGFTTDKTETQNHDWIYGTAKYYKYIDENKCQCLEEDTCTNCKGKVIKEFYTTEHNWKADRLYVWKKYSDSQCYDDMSFTCERCGGKKTERVLQNHDWVSPATTSDYKCLSDTQCSHVEIAYCGICHAASEPKTVTQNHSLKSVSINVQKATAISDTECSYSEVKRCDCGYEITVSDLVRKHNFGSDGACGYCGYKKNNGAINDTVYNQYFTAYKDFNIKITVPADGYLTLKSNVDMWYKLMDANGTVLSGMYSNMCSVLSDNSIPVKKGIYYLASINGTVDMKYSFTALTDKKNSTVKKAGTLKKNKALKGCVFAKDTKKNWTRYYKIKVTKKQKVTIRFDSYGAYTKFPGYITNTKGKKYKLKSTGKCSAGCMYETLDGNVKHIYADEYKTTVTLPKGTYILKLTNMNKWSNATQYQYTGAYYSLKWK